MLKTRICGTFLWLSSIFLLFGAVFAQNDKISSAISPQNAKIFFNSSKMLPKFHQSPWFSEQVREIWFESDVRIYLNAGNSFDPKRPTRLIIYATPNGNTIEQTLGSATAPGLDWHFDIQHIAAQTRKLREISPDENVVLACIEAEGLSWPAWRQTHPDNPAKLLSLVEMLRAEIPHEQPVRVTLSGHSGGGSFIFGFINSAATIPDYIDCIAFLDANYSYSDEPEKHGDKLLTWLKNAPNHCLNVIAYDDRNITLEGKKVVGPTGGTFRASQRMMERFKKDVAFTQSQKNAITSYSALNGRILFHIHNNPDNKILHTALVGEMNGFLAAMTQATPQASAWGNFGVGRSYTQWIQPAAVIPQRPQNAKSGSAFLAHIANFDAQAREQAIATEICRGNIPPFLRKFVDVTVVAEDVIGQEHQVIFQVMPDYLAIGSDDDFVRFPMTPQTAQLIADAFGCSLPTRKMVNEIYQQATVKLEPKPIAEAREATKTFAQHNFIIENQRAGSVLGLLVAGIKKDVVLSNLLDSKPNRVAIYGWHRLDGLPIQPLSTVHRDTYLDYSHGIRFIQRILTVDGKKRDIRSLLHSPQLSFLLSDEGALICATY